MYNSARNGKKIGRRWQFLTAAVYCSFLWISKENLETLLWRLLLQHFKNDRIRPLQWISFVIVLVFHTYYPMRFIPQVMVDNNLGPGSLTLIIAITVNTPFVWKSLLCMVMSCTWFEPWHSYYSCYKCVVHLT